MDWKAALALVKSQQSLLRQVLDEPSSQRRGQQPNDARVPSPPRAADAPQPTAAPTVDLHHHPVRRAPIVSPAVDVLPKAQHSPNRGADDAAASPGTPVSRASSSPASDTVSFGSPAAVPSDILRTPAARLEDSSRYEESSTAEVSLVRPAADEQQVALPPRYDLVEGFVRHVFTSCRPKEHDDDDGKEESVPSSRVAIRCPAVVFFDVLSDEYRLRQEVSMAEEACRMHLVAAARVEWAAMEVRDAVEFSFLDSFALRMGAVLDMHCSMLRGFAVELRKKLSEKSSMKVAPRKSAPPTVHPQAAVSQPVAPRKLRHFREESPPVDLPAGKTTEEKAETRIRLDDDQYLSMFPVYEDKSSVHQPSAVYSHRPPKATTTKAEGRPQEGSSAIGTQVQPITTDRSENTLHATEVESRRSGERSLSSSEALDATSMLERLRKRQLDHQRRLRVWEKTHA